MGGRARAPAVPRRCAVRCGERIRVRVAACRVRSGAGRVCGRELHAAASAGAGRVGPDAADSRGLRVHAEQHRHHDYRARCAALAQGCARISRT
jgi:hypothetical protein